MICIHQSRVRASRVERRGSVLVITLMVTMGIAMLGACLLQFNAAASRTQIHGVDKKRAFYLAEAGLSESIYGLRVGESGNLGTPEAPAKFGDGVVWVVATKSADGRVQLDSTGLCGGGRATLSLVVEKHSESPAALGIFSDGNLVVRSGSVIDSYGGGEGEADEPVQVGSNANIDIQGTRSAPTTIAGDVTPGISGTVTSGATVTITGSTAPRSAPIVLPPIAVPALTSQGSMMHLLPLPRTISAGEHRYDSLTVGTGAQLNIVGPQTLVVSSMVLRVGARLVLDTTNGTVNIYATDYLSFGANTTVNNTQQDPTRAHFLVSASQTIDRNHDGVPDPPLTMLTTGQMYATIYAPAASLTLSSGLELFGAVTSKSLVLSENARLHFNEALLLDDGSGPGSVSMLSWRVLSLPDNPLVRTAIDPVVLLRLQGVTLVKPSDAHQAVEFKIRFIDKFGNLVTWVGEEAKFDWTRVASVVQTARPLDALFRLL